MVKKKIILKDLFNNKCSKCGDSLVDILPLIQFHHTDPKIKRNSWGRLRSLGDVEKIKKILKEEKCIALCVNCHELIKDNTFKEHYYEILRKYSLDT